MMAAGSSEEEPEDESEESESEGADASAKRSETEEVAQVEDEVVEGEVEEDRRSGRRLDITASSWRGPLPPPRVLREYDEVIPGLAREIVDQWKGKTGHRHRTIDYLRETDRLAMEAYYESEKRGQYLSMLLSAGVAAIAIVAIVLKSAAVGVAALVSAAAAVIWAMRRAREGPSLGPTDLADGDELERGAQADE